MQSYRAMHPKGNTRQCSHTKQGKILKVDPRPQVIPSMAKPSNSIPSLRTFQAWPHSRSQIHSKHGQSLQGDPRLQVIPSMAKPSSSIPGLKSFETWQYPQRRSQPQVIPNMAKPSSSIPGLRASQRWGTGNVKTMHQTAGPPIFFFRPPAPIFFLGLYIFF